MRFPTRQINKKWEKEIEKASNASPTRRVKHFFFVNVNTIIRVSFIESPCASQLLAWEPMLQTIRWVVSHFQVYPLSIARALLAIKVSFRNNKCLIRL